MEKTSDPGLYLNLLTKIKESPEKANDDIRSFNEELRVIRKKYGIPDVLCVIMLNVAYAGEESGTVITEIYNGDSRNAETMAAHALGVYQAERRELVNTLIAGKATGKVLK